VDTTAVSTDLKPIGTFTQGCVTKFGLANIGSNMLYMAFDGIRSFKPSFDSNAVDTLNVSEAIKSEIQRNISSNIGSDIDLQLIHYPKRNWVFCKVGDTVYNFNYTPLYMQGQSSDNGSFTKFTGKFAQQNAYHFNNDGLIICCGENGLIYKFDNGNYDDDGDAISTNIESAWLTMEEPANTVNLKKGRYIRPTFETGADISYTISVVGDYTRTSTDSIVTTATGVGIIGRSVIGQSPIGGVTPISTKLPLSWRGRQFRVTFETSDTKGHDIISNFSIYGELLGAQ